MEKMTFEEKMIELEKIVDKLENNQISLEESLKLYERGKELSDSLEKDLIAANEKVAFIMNKNEKKPYNPEEDTEE